MLTIKKILSKPYRQLMRYNCDVECINEHGETVIGSAPSTSLKYIQQLKEGDEIYFIE
jgi:hypothetical protein